MKVSLQRLASQVLLFSALAFQGALPVHAHCMIIQTEGISIRADLGTRWLSCIHLQRNHLGVVGVRSVGDPFFSYSAYAY